MSASARRPTREALEALDGSFERDPPMDALHCLDRLIVMHVRVAVQHGLHLLISMVQRALLEPKGVRSSSHSGPRTSMARATRAPGART